MTHRNVIGDLQRWFRTHSDGDWEHDWRVRITTLDNPGWDVSINLDGMELQAPLERIDVERTAENWYSCWLDGVVFNAVGGPENLAEILEFFLNWVDARASTARR